MHNVCARKRQNKNKKDEKFLSIVKYLKLFDIA